MSRLPWVGALLISGATLWLALAYAGADLTISDTLGYTQAAHQLANGDGLAYSDPHNRLDARYYMLYAFKVIRPSEANRSFGFLPGVPLLAAAAERLTGRPEAVHIVTPVAAALTILVIFWLGSLLLDAWSGWWACLALFVAPTFARFSADLWSEIPSALFLYGGLVLVVLALRRKADDRTAAALAIGGGLAVGATFFMRFSNVTVVPAVLALIGLVGGRAAFKQRRSVGLISALLIALGSLLVFNTVYFGSPFDTGYSPRHGWYAQPAFSLAYALGPAVVGGGYSLLALGREVLNALGGLVLLVVVGLLARPRRVGWWLGGTAAVLLLPYVFYAFSAQDLNTRFIIPALPALCLLAGRGIVSIGKLAPAGVVRGALGVTLGALLLYRVPQNAAVLADTRQGSQATIEQTLRLIQPTEPNAVILSYVYNDIIAVFGQRSVMNYRHMAPYDEVTGKYQYALLEGILVAEVNRLLDEGTPVYYILDGNPPLFRSDEMLRRHFELIPIAAEQPVYRVGQRAP
jgi:hypothetical protein